MEQTLHSHILIDPTPTVISGKDVAPRDERYKVWEINQKNTEPISLYQKHQHVEILKRTLLRLLFEGQVCAVEINCLDCETNIDR